MEPPEAGNDDRTHAPNRDHRPKRIAPLYAQRGNRRGIEKEHRADPEIRRIPEVPAAPADDVLGQYGERAAQGVGPEKRRADEDSDADPGDVGAGEVRPFPD